MLSLTSPRHTPTLRTTDIAEPEKTAREIRPRLLVSQTGPGLDVGYDCLCFGDLGKRGVDANPAILESEGRVWADRWCGRKGVLGELEWRPSLSRSRVTADALDHGAHAIRALWRKMLLEAQPAKSAQGVDGENLLRRAIGEYRDRDRD
jgi:hypothetical protein